MPSRVCGIFFLRRCDRSSFAPFVERLPTAWEPEHVAPRRQGGASPRDAFLASLLDDPRAKGRLEARVGAPDLYFDLIGVPDTEAPRVELALPERMTREAAVSVRTALRAYLERAFRESHAAAALFVGEFDTHPDDLSAFLRLEGDVLRELQPIDWADRIRGVWTVRDLAPPAFAAAWPVQDHEALSEHLAPGHGPVV